ncbi:hypothetical protein J132_00912 [Termitomyces sp. J132]|nr:hypothetical protein J132_00912 [Termitomyces sp. J132]
MVASKGKKDVEMRETTLLATVAEVECKASDMEVEGEEEFEAAPVTIEEEKDEVAEGTKQMQQLFQDSMAICRNFGKPDLFLTMTANPK